MTRRSIELVFLRSRVGGSLYLITVIYLLDDLVHGRGFTATYQETIGQCGGQLASASGSFTSPNYPGNYGSMKDCEWSIDVGEGKN